MKVLSQTLGIIVKRFQIKVPPKKVQRHCNAHNDKRDKSFGCVGNWIVFHWKYPIDFGPWMILLNVLFWNFQFIDLYLQGYCNVNDKTKYFCNGVKSNVFILVIWIDVGTWTSTYPDVRKVFPRQKKNYQLWNKREKVSPTFYEDNPEFSIKSWKVGKMLMWIFWNFYLKTILVFMGPDLDLKTPKTFKLIKFQCRI